LSDKVALEQKYCDQSAELLILKDWLQETLGEKAILEQKHIDLKVELDKFNLQQTQTSFHDDPSFELE